jgi:formiminotetrahydrofolate cyclodeaminase
LSGSIGKERAERVSVDPFYNQTFCDFLEYLSLGLPTPGGGSAAALVGSIGAGLMAMVCKVNLKKEGSQNKSKFEQKLKEVEKCKEKLLKLSHEDTEAFNLVINSYQLPKNSPSRAEEIEKALKKATEVPCKIAENCLKVLACVEKVISTSIDSVITELGASAYLSEAALQAALLNVDINLKSIRDQDFKIAYKEKRSKLSQKGRSSKEKIISIIKNKI